MYMYTHTHTHVCTHTYVCTYMLMDSQTGKYVHIHRQTHANEYLHINTPVYITYTTHIVAQMYRMHTDTLHLRYIDNTCSQIINFKCACGKKECPSVGMENKAIQTSCNKDCDLFINGTSRYS